MLPERSRPGSDPRQAIGARSSDFFEVRRDFVDIYAHWASHLLDQIGRVISQIETSVSPGSAGFEWILPYQLGWIGERLNRSSNADLRSPERGDADAWPGRAAAVAVCYGDAAAASRINRSRRLGRTVETPRRISSNSITASKRESVAELADRQIGDRLAPAAP